MEAYIKVAVLENAIEAQLIESILKENALPHHIRSFHDTAYDGLFQMQKGWGVLNAPASVKDEMLKIVENVRSHESRQNSSP